MNPLEIDLTTDNKNQYYDSFQPLPTKGFFTNDHHDGGKIKFEPETFDLSLLKDHTPIRYSEPNKFIQSDNLEHEQSKPIHEIPQLEGGFKPIYTKNQNRPNQPRFRPGLLKTGKKPFTTPGLKNYGPFRGYQNYIFPPSLPSNGKNPRINYSSYFNPKGPILFPPTPEDKIGKSAELPRLYQNQAKSGFVRYGKTTVRF